MSISPFEKLVDMYPKGVYADGGLSHYLSRIYYKDDIIHLEKGMLIGKMFLDLYPENHYRGKAYGAIRNYFKKKDDLDGYTNSLIELYKSTNSANLKATIDNELKRINKYKSWDYLIQEPIKRNHKNKNTLLPKPPLVH